VQASGGPRDLQPGTAADATTHGGWSGARSTVSGDHRRIGSAEALSSASLSRPVTCTWWLATSTLCCGAPATAPGGPTGQPTPRFGGRTTTRRPHWPSARVPGPRGFTELSGCTIRDRPDRPGRATEDGRPVGPPAGSGWWPPARRQARRRGPGRAGGVLGDEGGGAGPAGGLLGLVAVEHRVDDHPNGGVGAGDAGGCLQAVKAGHAHVHHHHVGLEPRGQGDGLEPVGGLTDDPAARGPPAGRAAPRAWLGRRRRSAPVAARSALLRDWVAAPPDRTRSGRRRPARPAWQEGWDGLLTGGDDADEVQAQQQGGDDPVERWLVERSRRGRLKVQRWWHPRSWVGVGLCAVSARPVGRLSRRPCDLLPAGQTGQPAPHVNTGTGPDRRARRRTVGAFDRL
jgi:hypothetical protein